MSRKSLGFFSETLMRGLSLVTCIRKGIWTVYKLQKNDQEWSGKITHSHLERIYIYIYIYITIFTDIGRTVAKSTRVAAKYHNWLQKFYEWLLHFMNG